MRSDKFSPAPSRSPLIDYLAGIGSYPFMILTFRHSGNEWRSISSRHTAGLLAVAVAAVVVCSHFAPSFAHSRGSCALYALLIAAALRTFGLYAVAGNTAYLVASEPAPLVIRHLPMGQAIDAVFSLWCLAALPVFGGKCAKSRMESPQ